MVAEGYKQTEIGVIPEDWIVKNIGSLLHIKHGKSQKEVEVINGIYPILGTGGEIGRTNEPLYSKPSVLIGRKGTIDKPVYMDTPFWTVDTLFYSEINQKTHAKFIYYKFNQIDWYLYNEASGVPSLNAKTIENISIAIPPTIPEQQAISTALSDTDELLNSLQKLISKKEAIKTATMQELLTCKKDWKKHKLGSLATLINGRAYSISEWESSGAPVIRLQNLTGRGEIFYYSNLDLPEKQYCYKNDLLFMWSATFGPIIWQGSKAIFHYHIWKIECKHNQLSKMYLYHFLSDITEKLKRSSSSGGTMLHLTKSGMEKMKISIPTFVEQETIAQILSDMDSEIDTLKSKLSKIKAIKEGMMQELLTGRIRLLMETSQYA